MILGINPFFDDYYCFHDYKYQPIGILSVLATLRSAGYDVAVLDAVTKRRQQTRKPKELENTEGGYYRYGLGDKKYKATLREEYANPQVILMTSSMTFRWHSIRDAITLTKEVFPKVPVVLGGIYATLAYEHAKKHSGADFVIQGPGEAKALSLVNELTGNQRQMPEPMPFWAFDLLPAYKRNFAMLLTSYGCTRNCAHCASRLSYGGYRRRDTGEVIAERATR